jgi:hypothetical protein
MVRRPSIFSLNPLLTLHPSALHELLLNVKRKRDILPPPPRATGPPMITSEISSVEMRKRIS